ncbi:MAG: VOC family protein [Woeseiaceae bacterium]
MTNIIKLHHASLIVKDLARALSFYQGVLGLEVEGSRPDLGYPGAWLILSHNQQIHLMEIDNPDSESVRPDHGGRDHHIAFSVESIETLAQSLETLNMPYTKSKSGRKALFCRDPDGNALEFIQS